MLSLGVGAVGVRSGCPSEKWAGTGWGAPMAQLSMAGPGPAGSPGLGPRVIGSNLRVDHLLDLREDEVVCEVRKGQRIGIVRLREEGSALTCSFLRAPATRCTPGAPFCWRSASTSRRSASQPPWESPVRLLHKLFDDIGSSLLKLWSICTYSLYSIT